MIQGLAAKTLLVVIFLLAPRGVVASPSMEDYCSNYIADAKVIRLSSKSWEKFEVKEKDFLTSNYFHSFGSQGEFRWSKNANGVFLERQDVGMDFFAPRIPLSSCHGFKSGDFKKLKCLASYVLYYKSQIFAVSVADYAEEVGEVYGSVRISKNNYFLVELGIKAGKSYSLIPDTLNPKGIITCKEVVDELD